MKSQSRNCGLQSQAEFQETAKSYSANALGQRARMQNPEQSKSPTSKAWNLSLQLPGLGGYSRVWLWI
jgi:hypothetical protein